jgi:hypothetical protein
MIDFIADNFYYLFLGWLVLNLMQRKHRTRGSRNRTATLMQAILIFILYIGAMVIREEGLEPKWIMVPLAVVAAGIYFFRDRIFPYKRNCVSCGAKLNMNQIFMYDANLCSNCDPDEQPDADAGESDDSGEVSENDGNDQPETAVRDDEKES